MCTYIYIYIYIVVVPGPPQRRGVRRGRGQGGRRALDICDAKVRALRNGGPGIRAIGRTTTCCLHHRR